MTDRDFMSIGEVLDLLKADFPDVTISKIRFLESQGLLAPERTPSGYRKFFDGDVLRLRWILHQQKEHFLPLKVIKDRLDEDPEAVHDMAPAHSGEVADTDHGGAAEGEAPADDGAAAHDGPPADTATATAGSGPGADDPAAADEADAHADDAARRHAARAARARPTEAPKPAMQSGGTDRDRLAEATGLTVSELAELGKYGLLEERRSGGTVYYDADSVEVARLAAAFMRHGVEPRHLRMYRTAAEREATFLEQLVLPLLKQRNPDARRQAVDTLRELSELGNHLRSALVGRELREHLGG